MSDFYKKGESIFASIQYDGENDHIITSEIYSLGYRASTYKNHLHIRKWGKSYPENIAYVGDWICRLTSVYNYFVDCVVIVSDEEFSKNFTPYIPDKDVKEMVDSMKEVVDFYKYGLTLCSVCGKPISTYDRTYKTIELPNNTLDIHKDCWDMYKTDIFEKLVGENRKVKLRDI